MATPSTWSELADGAPIAVWLAKHSHRRNGRKIWAPECPHGKGLGMWVRATVAWHTTCFDRRNFRAQVSGRGITVGSLRYADFPGANRILVAQGCDDLPVFTDGRSVTSAWDLDANSGGDTFVISRDHRGLDVSRHG